MKDPTRPEYGGKITFSNQNALSKLDYCVFDSLGYYTGSSNGFGIEAATSMLEVNHSNVRNSFREGRSCSTQSFSVV